MEKLKAVGYVRVSTADQAREGVSLEAQEARIKAWAEANGYNLLVVHVDAGISGFKATNRPGLQSALNDACKNKAALVVYSLSRLARSTKDALSISERLDKAGADLVSLSERIDSTSAAGKMVFRMLAVLAEFERDLISERTSSAMAHLKTQGRRVGAVPLGFRESNGKLIPQAHEMAILARLRAFRNCQRLSFQAIADKMNMEHVPTKQGGRWYASTVSYLLGNSLYTQSVAA